MNRNPFNSKGVFTYPSPDIPSAEDLPISSIPNLDEILSNYNGPKDSGSPYELLYEFFQRKNAEKKKEPLSRIELLGINSLIQQLQPKSERDTSVFPLVSIHNPTLSGFDKYPNTANKFNPVSKRQSRVDETQASTTLQRRSSGNNTTDLPHYSPHYTANSKRTIDSPINFKPRKIIRLESIPTTYRPAGDLWVYKPHPDLIRRDDDDEDMSVSFDGGHDNDSISLSRVGENADVREEENTSMSQTASTMLSLINPIDDETQIHSSSKKLLPTGFTSPPNAFSQPKRPFVNPYSSRNNSRVHTSRRADVSPESSNSIIKNLELTMRGNKSPVSPKDSEAGASPGSVDNSFFNNGSPSLQRKPNTKLVDKHRPPRPSSLRKSLVANPSESESTDSPIVSSTLVINKPKITPTWVAPSDFIDDDEDVANEEANNASQTPISFQKSTATTFGLPKQLSPQNSPAPTGLFTFGTPKSQEPKTGSISESTPKEDHAFSKASTEPTSTKTPFSFGNHDASTNTASIPKAAEPVQQKSLFSAGVSSQQSEKASKGLFAFGSTEKKDEDGLKQSSVATTVDVDKDSAAATTANKPFTFGGFGTETNKDTTGASKAPLFSKPSTTGSLFSTNGASSSAPKFSFGSTPTAIVSNAGGFKFGSTAVSTPSATTATKDENTQPATGTTGVLFGVPGSVASEEKSDDAPGKLLFGSNNNDNNNNNKISDESGSKTNGTVATAVSTSEQMTEEEDNNHKNNEDEDDDMDFDFEDSVVIEPPEAPVDEALVKSFREDYVF